MPKAKRLPSGSWRAQASYKDENGKRRFKSFTATSKKEAERLAANFEKPSTALEDMTFREAYELYLASRSNTLSPSTLRGYRQCERHLEPLMDKALRTFDQDTVSLFINRLAAKYSPKTCRNVHGLLSPILKKYAGLKLETSLPQKIIPEYVIPTDEDIDKILKYLKENDEELRKAVLLSAFGTLRRSEICALSASDINGNVIHIKKAMVRGPEGLWHIKTTKTVSSDRYVTFPEFVIECMPKDGALVSLNPNQVTDRFEKTLKRLAIPSFRFHDLRHYAASVMHAMGVPDQYIMATGGWSSDHTLKNIYRNTISTFEKAYDEKRLSYFNKFGD